MTGLACDICDMKMWDSAGVLLDSAGIFTRILWDVARILRGFCWDVAGNWMEMSWDMGVKHQTCGHIVDVVQNLPFSMTNLWHLPEATIGWNNPGKLESWNGKLRTCNVFPRILLSIPRYISHL